ncbi:LVIVD repeat-containing protein [Luteipulveratus mongoliensis]|uniref:LVIVD repeat-containing protein n=1 Tax=Luteipulveratus mongoliensis TaxID=571913 RepID=A0A0K1JFY9_9MICO|nr:hypothetical protein [Luteipulveratus mongoliensis]AKU15619.1 hypothetical protein VV02_06720 [Luteipulveratus mongoliensis]
MRSSRRFGLALITSAALATSAGVSMAAATGDPGDGSGPVGDEQIRSHHAPAAKPGDPLNDPAEIGRSGLGLQADQIGRSANVKRAASVAPSGPLADGTGTDIAFQGNKAFVGNYNGFTIFDVSKPSKPKMLAQVLCPGSQNDVSVSGNLLYLSTDSSRSDDSCASTPQPATEKSSWEGIKIFDISDVRNPKYIKSVETACGSHTHTLIPGRSSEFLYVSSYSPNETYPDCKPPHDSISIIEVPKKAPTQAKVVAEPNLFPDGGTPNAGTTGCHDITAYPLKNLAAGACMGDGIILDIKNPAAPKVIERVSDKNFAFWHSATFNNAGTKVIFTDELGGGGAATCNEKTGPERGADAIYDLSKRNKLTFKSYFKISRYQTDDENCVAHNGSLVPVKGKDIMVQSWYMGGTQIWDFTDSAHPKELGYFERGPAAGEDGGGTWSSYYYNGHVYSSDLGKGFDIFKVSGKDFDQAAKVKMDQFNPQSQPYVGKH